jgi:hypothetical protein
VSATSEIDPSDLVIPFGEDLAVEMRERPVGMAGTVQGTSNPVKSTGGDTIDDEQDDPDPGPS